MDPIQIAQIEENGSKGKEKGKEPIIPYTEEHALSRQNTEVFEWSERGDT